MWLAHCVHLSDGDIAKLAATGTGVAHCPSSNGRLGSGIARVPELLAAGLPVGLGVDGVASNEHAGLAAELRQAVLAARYRLGPRALTARQALAMGTMGGARCLGRQDDLGSIEVGKLADLALWRLDGLGHADIADPVCALVFGPPAPLELLLVGGNRGGRGRRAAHRRRGIDRDRGAGGGPGAGPPRRSRLGLRPSSDPDRWMPTRAQEPSFGAVPITTGCAQIDQ